MSENTELNTDALDPEMAGLWRVVRNPAKKPENTTASKLIAANGCVFVTLMWDHVQSSLSKPIFLLIICIFLKYQLEPHQTEASIALGEQK